MTRFAVTIFVAAILAGSLFLACAHDSPATPSAPPSGSTCSSFTLSGVKETFGPSGGSATVTVTGVPAGCGGTWSASSSAGWLTVATDLLMNGGGRVTYQVAANPVPSGERSGTLTVAGQSVVVRQVSAITFNYTGSAQTWVVPGGVTSLDVDIYGAAGGRPADYPVEFTGEGSLGGRVQTTVTVVPGATLYIYVGGAGTSRAGGFNGGGAPGGYPSGGGGGASDIRLGGAGLENRVVVAGGAGGGGCYSPYCGAGQGGPGGGLSAAGSSYYSCPFGSAPAGGGNQSAGGRGGSCEDDYSFFPYHSSGTAGSAGLGGTGGPGQGLDGYDPGSGGGGGYYGGGGGGGNGAGGGGSSYSAGTNTVHTPGVRSGNGLVVITVR